MKNSLPLYFEKDNRPVRYLVVDDFPSSPRKETSSKMIGCSAANGRRSRMAYGHSRQFNRINPGNRAHGQSPCRRWKGIEAGEFERIVAAEPGAVARNSFMVSIRRITREHILGGAGRKERAFGQKGR